MRKGIKKWIKLPYIQMVHAHGNPGPGGWGAILMFNDVKKEISGGNPNTTNNIMEITAVLEALKLLKKPCEVELYSDSAYVVNCFNNGWIYNWMKNNWRTANKYQFSAQDKVIDPEKHVPTQGVFDKNVIKGTDPFS